MVNLSALAMFVAVELGFSYSNFPTPDAMLTVVLCAGLFRIGEFVPSRRELALAWPRLQSRAMISICAGISHSGLHALLEPFRFSSLFRHGLQHNAEETDHLLFLLGLLLPAPLLAVGSGWRGIAGVRRSLLRVADIVTAFTIGHSMTLTLAAMNVIDIPSRPSDMNTVTPEFVQRVNFEKGPLLR